MSLRHSLFDRLVSTRHDPHHRHPTPRPDRTPRRPVQRRGVTQQPGLYFLGLHWMHTIKSGRLSGVGNDAEYLAEHIAGMT